MKKLIVASVLSVAIAGSTITAQAASACICIPGVIWMKGCPVKQKPTTPTTPTTPTPPTETPVTDTPTPATPETPSVVTAAATTSPTAPVTTASAVTTTMPEALPETGPASSAVIAALLGLGTFGAASLIVRRSIKQ